MKIWVHKRKDKECRDYKRMAPTDGSGASMARQWLLRWFFRGPAIVGENRGGEFYGLLETQ